MHPFMLRDIFFKRIRVSDYSDLEGKDVKITLVRGVPFADSQLELVVDDCFYMPPHANEKPVVDDANMLYITFDENVNGFDGIEMYLKEGKSLHAQLIGPDPSFVYQKIKVAINDVDLDWFDYLEVIKPTQH
jgi:hypothetical protein